MRKMNLTQGSILPARAGSKEISYQFLLRTALLAVIIVGFTNCGQSDKKTAKVTDSVKNAFWKTHSGTWDLYYGGWDVSDGSPGSKPSAANLLYRITASDNQIQEVSDVKGSLPRESFQDWKPVVNGEHTITVTLGFKAGRPVGQLQFTFNGNRIHGLFLHPRGEGLTQGDPIIGTVNLKP